MDVEGKDTIMNEETTKEEVIAILENLSVDVYSKV